MQQYAISLMKLDEEKAHVGVLTLPGVVYEGYVIDAADDGAWIKIDTIPPPGGSRAETHLVQIAAEHIVAVIRAKA